MDVAKLWKPVSIISVLIAVLLLSCKASEAQKISAVYNNGIDFISWDCGIGSSGYMVVGKSIQEVITYTDSGGSPVGSRVMGVLTSGGTGKGSVQYGGYDYEEAYSAFHLPCYSTRLYRLNVIYRNSLTGACVARTVESAPSTKLFWPDR